MVMKKSILQGSGILVILVLVLAFGLEAEEKKGPSSEISEKRSDIVTIDTLKSFGPLERPEVIFFHDLHTMIEVVEDSSRHGLGQTEKFRV